MQVMTYRRFMRRQQQSGFTLIELLTVVALVVIGLSLALPDLSSFIRRNQISGATNELMAAMTFARTEAIKRGAPVVICASSNSTGASPSCTGNWEQGYIVFVDTNAGGTRQTAEEVLRAAPASSARVTIQLSGAQAQVRFAPNGMLHGQMAGARFEIKNSSSPTGSREERYICIARAGRAAAINFDTYTNDPRFAGCGA
jgi:type IV fimbrial biogenesis protein FimT